ncbi:DNA-binding domain-containing protein [Sphingobium sp. AS12]|uniref:HvfC/BufC family peptide modification chaperone n=1 Tax=Sphingobium sp. AS12 TaxID=2849495 RepID=UPI001C31DEDA|nr:putative DNA-binding domain-containing protein [Sphingobium sp. AS12]MBV2150105.1 DNA-binding domain-containing protein [Sphingobium sp. AS12]
MPDAQSFQQAFGAMLAAPSAMADTALRRALAVHRNTATKAVRDALFANYPVLAALVGNDAFAACAAAYVEVMPPGDPRLCLYGERFPAFVDAWVPFVTAPYLAAVARVERLVTEALFAADAPALDPDALVAGFDPDAPLCWHPATRVACLAAPAASLWRAHQADAPADAFDTIVWAPEMVLVTRLADAVEVRPIDAPAQAFLGGGSLAAAAANAADAGGDVAVILAGLLAAGAFAAQHRQGER